MIKWNKISIRIVLTDSINFFLCAKSKNYICMMVWYTSVEKKEKIKSVDIKMLTKLYTNQNST